MEALEVTQKLFSSKYSVCAPGSDDVVLTVDQLTLREGDDELATMTQNFWATRATIVGPDGAELAQLQFPSPLGFGGKRVTLTVGEQILQGTYAVTDRVSGGVTSGRFACADERGEVGLEIAKELTLKHRFTVRFSPRVGREVGVLAAVAIDKRFFAMRRAGSTLPACSASSTLPSPPVAARSRC